MLKLDEFMRINEAADYLGVCRNTLRNWCREGKIPEYRHPVNNYRLFKVSDLERLLVAIDRPVNQTARPRPRRRPR
jgi:excisionase family DNA binding protein